jgi:hypothetical protein
VNSTKADRPFYIMSSNKPLVISAFGTLSELTSGNELASVANSYTLITSSTTANSGDKLAVNTFAAPVTITLPTSPQAGDVIRIKDYRRTFATNNVTVDPDAKKVEGFLGAFVLDVDGIEADMEFINDTQGWLVRFKF